MLVRLTLPMLGLSLAALTAACAPPSARMATAAPVSTLSGPANVGAAPMGGMDHSGMMDMKGMDHSGMNMQDMKMGGMDMNTMMSHCAQMRQQSGANQTPQRRQMLDQCDKMDRSMGMTPAARR